MVGPKGHFKTIRRELSLLAWEGSSSVVDQDLQGLSLGLECSRALADGCKGSQVEWDGFNACVWNGGAHLGYSFFAFCLITRGEDDVKASCHEYAGCGKPDTAVPTGDHDDALLTSCHVNSLDQIRRLLYPVSLMNHLNGRLGAFGGLSSKLTHLGYPGEKGSTPFHLAEGIK
jgi:hypothetical protein